MQMQKKIVKMRQKMNSHKKHVPSEREKEERKTIYSSKRFHGVGS